MWANCGVRPDVDLLLNVFTKTPNGELKIGFYTHRLNKWCKTRRQEKNWHKGVCSKLNNAFLNPWRSIDDKVCRSTFGKRTAQDNEIQSNDQTAFHAVPGGQRRVHGALNACLLKPGFRGRLFGRPPGVQSYRFKIRSTALSSLKDVPDVLFDLANLACRQVVHCPLHNGMIQA